MALCHIVVRLPVNAGIRDWSFIERLTRKHSVAEYIILLEGATCPSPLWLPHPPKERALQMPPPVFRDVPLPELTNDEHYKWVFTHRSAVTIPSSVRVTESATEDYERWASNLNGPFQANCLGSISLALIGEVALHLCVMEYLYEACPLSRPSDLSVSLSYVYNIHFLYLLKCPLLVLGHRPPFFE